MKSREVAFLDKCVVVCMEVEFPENVDTQSCNV